MSSIASILVTINVNSSGVSSSLQQAQQSINGFTDSMKNVGNNLKSIGADMTRLGGVITAGVTVPMVAFGKASFDASTEFELNIKRVTSLMGDMADKFEGEFTQSVRTLAVTMGVDAVEAARGLYDVISADIPPQNAIDFLTTATKAAVAGLTNVETAAGAIRTIVKIWPEEMNNLGTVANVLFAGVNKGIYTFEQLAHSMGQALPIAAHLGISYKEIVAQGAQLTQAGLSASQAFTYLKQEINSLLKPTKELGLVFEKLHVANGQQLIEKYGSLALAMQAVRTKAGEMGLEMSAVMGRVQGFQAVLGTTGDKLIKTVELTDYVTNSTNALDSAYNKLEESASRSIDKMKSQWGDLKITVGDALRTTMKPLIEEVTRLMGEMNVKLKELVERFQAMPEEAQHKLMMIAAGIAAIGPAIATIGLGITAVGSLISSIGKIAAAFEYLSGPALGVGAALTGIAIAAAAVAAAWAVFDISQQLGDWTGLKDIVKSVWDVMVGLGEALVPLGAVMVDLIKIGLTPIVIGFKELTDLLGPLIKAIGSELVEAMKGVSGALVQLKKDLDVYFYNQIQNWKDSRDRVMDMAEAIKKNLTPAYEEVTRKVIEFVNKIRDFVNSIPLVKQAYDLIIGAMQKMGLATKDLGPALHDTSENFAKLDASVDATRKRLQEAEAASIIARDGFHKVGEGVLLATPHLSSFEEGLNGIFHKADLVTPAIKSGTTPAVTNLGVAAKETAKDIHTVLLPAFDAIASKIPEVEGKANSLASFFDGFFGNTIRILADGAINLSDNFKTLGDAAGETELKMGGLSIKNEQTMDGLGKTVTIIRGSSVPAHKELTSTLDGTKSAYDGVAGSAASAANAMATNAKAAADAASAIKSANDSIKSSGGGSGGNFAPSDFSPSDFSSSMKSSWGSGGSFTIKPSNIGGSPTPGTKAGDAKYMSGAGGASMPMGGTASFNSIEVHLWTQEELDKWKNLEDQAKAVTQAMVQLASAGLLSTEGEAKKLVKQMEMTGQSMSEVVDQWKQIGITQKGLTKATDEGDRSIEALRNQLWRLIDAGKGSSGAAWELRQKIESLGGSMDGVSSAASNVVTSVGKASAAMLTSFDGISQTADKMAETVRVVTTRARAWMSEASTTPLTTTTPSVNNTPPRAFTMDTSPSYYGPMIGGVPWEPYRLPEGYSPGLGDMTLGQNVNLTVNVNNADAQNIADTIASTLRSSGMQI